MNTAVQRPRIRIVFERAKDAYCYYCEDGGAVIECSNLTCNKAFCFNTLGNEINYEEAPESQACVTIPPEMVESRSYTFRCPECLKVDPPSRMDYAVNRGSCNTRRIASRASLVIILYYLSSLAKTAASLLNQLVSAVAGLEVHVVTLQCQVTEHLSEKDLKETVKELLPEAPYHVAVVFFTEGNDGGGWWWSTAADPDQAQQTSESQFLAQMLSPLNVLIRPAVSARVFGVSCGINLRESDSVKDIFQYMNSHLWNSMVLATAVSLLPSDYICILPELFVELYYFGSPFRSSILRVWAKSPVARTHTGLLVMERSDRVQETLHVTRFEHAPPNSRPLGVDLPEVTSLCDCWKRQDKDDAHDPRWNRHHQSMGHGEIFLFFRSTCCNVELHVAIFPGFRRQVQAHGVLIAEEVWDEKLQRFTFDFSDMVKMQVSRKRSAEEQKERPSHDIPWTVAGLKAQAAALGNQPGARRI